MFLNFVTVCPLKFLGVLYVWIKQPNLIESNPHFKSSSEIKYFIPQNFNLVVALSNMTIREISAETSVKSRL